MSDVRAIQEATEEALQAITAAIRAVGKLYGLRESLPALVNQRRTLGQHEHQVQRLAEGLHYHESALARHLLEPLSGTELGKLILSHGRERISFYRHGRTPGPPDETPPPAAA